MDVFNPSDLDRPVEYSGADHDLVARDDIVSVFPREIQNVKRENHPDQLSANDGQHFNRRSTCEQKIQLNQHDHHDWERCDQK